MKKTILSIAVIAAAFVAASCQKENLQENITPEGSASVFTATIESGANTKTTVERVTSPSVAYKTYWESTDKISINGVTYSAAPDGTDATKATFTKVVEASNPAPTYKAYFPASLYSGTPTLPANINETWADGKYNMPMYAESETTALEFKNLCGVLKVTVTSGQLASVKSITVSSTNCATSGKFSVSDNKAVLTEASNTANTVTVTYTTAVSTEDGDKVFYVAIPAQTYKNLSIAVSDGTTTKVMTTNKNEDITVARNTVYPISFDGTLIAGTAKRTGDIDVRWVQLWENGPKFAEYNVGATSATDYGGYYTWGGSTDMSSSDFNTGSDPLSGNNDTATNLWGSIWRMPTQAELMALRNPTNCTVKWTGAGLLCTGKGAYASNSVFLPAAKRRGGQDNDGFYWSSTPDGGDTAYYLYFISGEPDVIPGGLRTDGFSVRAVLNETSLPEGALKGEFSVSATKTVHFSQGNLIYDVNATTNKWKFYEHQYDCATGYDANLISLFTWGYDEENSIDPDGTEYVSGHDLDGESFYSTEDWGTQIGDGNTWRTLSKEEWCYLFNTRTMTYNKSRYSNAVSGVTIGSATYKGVFIYPDNYNGDVVSSGSMTWDQINAAGIVFLPAAGDRYGSSVNNVGVHGFYWSSTAYDSFSAYNVYFYSSEFFPNSSDEDNRDIGFSVRLITECQ